MSRKNKIILFVFLMIPLGAFYSHAKESVPLKGESNKLFNKAELMQLIIDNNKKQVSIREDWNSRDPFDVPVPVVKKELPPKEQVVVKPKLLLEGVFLGSSKPSAIINGAVWGVGDKLNGMIIQEIKDNTVILTDSEGKHEVLLLRLEKN